MPTKMDTKKQCFICKEELGLVHCTGCNEYFCWKNLQIHRQEMITEMDDIVKESNYLQEEMNKGIKVDIQECPLVEDIDKWEKNTIEKVKQIASDIRQQILELMKNQQIKVTFECESFFKELARLKESQNYVEPDLERLRVWINQLKLQLVEEMKLTTVKLYTKEYNSKYWNGHIYLKEVEKSSINNQQEVKQQEPVTEKLQKAIPTLPNKLSCSSYSSIK